MKCWTVEATIDLFKWEQHCISHLFIAIPSASRSILRELLKEVEEYSVKVRILPGLAELAQGKVLVSELKEVDITDLLGRYEVEADQQLIDRNIKNKTVLITGAGGSIGSEIARQVARNNPKTLILLDAKTDNSSLFFLVLLSDPPSLSDFFFVELFLSFMSFSIVL